MSLPIPIQTPVRDVALGMAAAAVAGLLQWSLQRWLGPRVPFLFFVPAVIFTAASVGRVSAGVVLLAGAVSAELGFPPQGSWMVADPRDAWAIAAYLLVGGLVIAFGGRLQLRHDRAQRAEARLSLAQDETGVGLFELDYQAGTAYASPALCQMLGQPAMASGSMALKRWLAMLDAGHVEDSRNALQRKIEAGELRYERELRVALPDGSHRWLLSRIRLDLDANGQLAAARGATLDISARKQLLAELEQTQLQLRQRLDDLNQLHGLSNHLLAMPYLDAALQATLEAVASFHGTPHGLLRRREPGGQLHLAARCGLDAAQMLTLDALPAAADTGAMAASTARRVVVEDVETDPRFPGLRELATTLGVRALHSTPLVGSVSGQVLGVLTVLVPAPGTPDERLLRLTDLCAAQAVALIEREQALLQAREAQLRFDVALQSSSIAFTILAPVRDPIGNIIDFSWTYANPAAAQLMGHAADVLVGRHVLEVLPHAWDEPGTLERYVAVVEAGVAAEFDLPVRRPEYERWLHVILSPLEESLVVWFSDITERRLQEQALQQADRRKDEFLAMLAHELRNPLAPARQAAAIASNPTATDAQRRWGHDVIERQLGHMALLLDDLLDVSRITRGALALRRTRAALAPIIDAAVEMARPLLDARGHRLVLSLPEETAWLDADPLRLAQVLGNLLTNAAKYTHAGGRIELAAHCEGGPLVLTVSDNGIGLKGEERERVFEMFIQVANNAGHRPDGLGIGLALSRSLVELHGGTLTADSPGPGQGSTFTLVLPSTLPPPPAASATPATPTVATAAAVVPTNVPNVRRRILVVDDNRDAAESLALLLDMQGHEVQVAYDGREALSRFESFRPDVALLDVGLPEHSGLEVAARIRVLHPNDRPTLVAITGWGGMRDRGLALEAGFDHHLTKPVELDQLQALLDKDTANS